MRNRSSLTGIVHLLIIYGTLFCIPDHAIAAVRIVIVAFGDSITVGWPYHEDAGQGCQCPPEGYEVQLEEQMYSAGYNIEVYNYGIAGENTSQGIDRLDSVIASEKPDYVLLMEGTNDLREFSPETVKANLSIMVDKVRSGGAIPILATLTPDTRDLASEKDIPYTNTLIKELRDEKNVLFSDQHAAVADDWSNLSYDDLHPNEAGYGKIAETWGSTLLQELSSPWILFLPAIMTDTR